MDLTQIAREESVAVDPNDQTAVETDGAVYKGWVVYIGYDNHSAAFYIV
ncbi:hypothetical protein HAPAU_37430 [Halalkalicoccus paucihalophilus]|uniref:Uncharacterized protein n=1 Tax=Halalkalicoccus paucihalophilus TaxID=1008153 RepID=A0A151A965_9EURY|nr:hypothetical protein HAPAU_37430 [Halalkalicoccus paucihalophilus]